MWIAGIVVADDLFGWLGQTEINTALPASVLLVSTRNPKRRASFCSMLCSAFGLIVFRRCARDFFQSSLGDGYLLPFVTSLLFGTYHWWTVVGGMVHLQLGPSKGIYFPPGHEGHVIRISRCSCIVQSAFLSLPITSCFGDAFRALWEETIMALSAEGKTRTAHPKTIVQ